MDDILCNYNMLRLGENMVTNYDGSAIQLKSELPLLPIRDLVVYPYMILPLFIGRPTSVKAVEESLEHYDRQILLSSQKHVQTEIPSPDDIHTMGTVAVIMRMRRLGDGRLKILVQGVAKARITNFDTTESYYKVNLTACPEEQKKIREVNSGVYLIRTSYIKRYLDEISSDNSAGEFYLTDLFKPDIPIKACRFQDPNLFLGVNTFEQLAEIESILRKKKIKELQEAGVYFEDPQSIYIDLTVEIEEEVRIGGMVKISGDTKISKGSIIEQGCIIKSSQIGESNHILAYSYLEKSILGPGNQIGPFARLREGTQLDGNCKIGNFVETKKAHLKEGSKASHLSYIGDAEIGERTNIGCGFITCNYDGKDKHQTKIGADSFIGSDVQMIAPVELGDEVFVAAGSTINENIPSGGFGIARSKQSTKEGMAKKFIKKK